MAELFLPSYLSLREDWNSLRSDLKDELENKISNILEVARNSSLKVTNNFKQSLFDFYMQKKKPLIVLIPDQTTDWNQSFISIENVATYLMCNKIIAQPTVTPQMVSFTLDLNEKKKIEVQFLPINKHKLLSPSAVQQICAVILSGEEWEYTLIKKSITAAPKTKYYFFSNPSQDSELLNNQQIQLINQMRGSFIAEDFWNSFIEFLMQPK